MFADTHLNKSLANGVAFLLARQGADGLWRDFETFAGEAIDWPTGFIGAQLLGAGVRGAPICAAADALLSRQRRDGGWGYHRNVPSDADSTACVLMFLATAGCEDAKIEMAGRCLRRHQDPRSGGISTYVDPVPIRRYMLVGRSFDVRGWCAHHVEVTANAGRAFAEVSRGRFRPEAQLAWRYVEHRQASDAGWYSYWWVDRAYPTFLAVALGCSLGDTKVAELAAGWALSEQLAGGAWGAGEHERSAFATALALAVMLRSGAHRCEVGRGLNELISMQQADGGWPAHALMRIPPPHVVEPDKYESWRVGNRGTGIIVHDHHRLFTTSVCVATLALALADESVLWVH